MIKVMNKAGTKHGDYEVGTYVKAPAFWDDQCLLDLGTTQNEISTKWWMGDKEDGCLLAQHIDNVARNLDELYSGNEYSTEEESKQFVIALVRETLFFVNKVSIVAHTDPLVMFFERLLKSADQRFGYGKIDILIGKEVDEKPTPIVLTIECKGSFQTSPHAQVISQLLCHLSIRMRQHRPHNWYETYAVLSDGLNYRFFAAQIDGDGFDVIRSDRYTIGQFNKKTGKRKFVPDNQGLATVIKIVFNLLLSQAKDQSPLQVHNSIVLDLRQKLTELQAQITERDAQITELQAQLTERDAQITELQAQIIERDAQLTERDAQITERDAQIIERDAQITELQAKVEEIRQQLAELRQQNRRRPRNRTAVSEENDVEPPRNRRRRN
jgi:hypothetical protein